MAQALVCFATGKLDGNGCSVYDGDTKFQQPAAAANPAAAGIGAGINQQHPGNAAEAAAAAAAAASQTAVESAWHERRQVQELLGWWQLDWWWQ